MFNKSNICIYIDFEVELKFWFCVVETMDFSIRCHFKDVNVTFK